MELLAINFHYFREEIPEQGIYPTTKKMLSDQIDVLSKNFKFISPEELVGCIKNRDLRNGRYCIFTFDDGLKEQIDAYKFLLEKGIKAAMFPMSMPTQHGAVANVHKLHHIRASGAESILIDALNLNKRFKEYEFDLELLKKQYRYDSLETSKLKYYLNFVLSEIEKELLINQVFNDIVGNDIKNFIRNFYMNEDDIKYLSKEEVLGTHGSSHVPMAQLKVENCNQEILNSKNYLESVTGKSIEMISYPFGGPSAVNERVAEIAESNNLTLGFSMFRGINQINDFSNPMLLKRVDTNDAPGGKYFKN